MILEAAFLDVRAGQERAFQAALGEAVPLIQSISGFRKIEVRPCIESGSRYLLLVWWDKLEDHTVGFRQSPQYAKWREALHRFYEPFPTVLHFAEPI